MFVAEHSDAAGEAVVVRCVGVRRYRLQMGIQGIEKRSCGGLLGGGGIWKGGFFEFDMTRDENSPGFKIKTAVITVATWVS